MVCESKTNWTSLEAGVTCIINRVSTIVPAIEMQHQGNYDGYIVSVLYLGHMMKYSLRLKGKPERFPEGSG